MSDPAAALVRKHGRELPQAGLCYSCHRRFGTGSEGDDPLVLHRVPPTLEVESLRWNWNAHSSAAQRKYLIL